MELIDKQILGFEKSKLAFALLVVSGITDAAAIFGQAVSLATAISNVWHGDGLAAQWVAVGVFVACYLARQAISYLRSKSLEKYSQGIGSKLRRDLLETAFEQGQAFVSRHGSGAITTTLIEGISQIESHIHLMLPKVADLIAIPLTLSAALFYLDWISGIIALVMLPFIMLYMKFLGLNAKMAAQRQHDKYEQMANHFSDTMRGISTLKFFGISKAYAKKIHSVSERFGQASLATIKVATLSSLVIDLFRTFALAAIAIMLGFRLMAGSIDLMPALAALIIVPEFFGAVRRFSTDFHASLDGKNQLAAIIAMLDEPIEQKVELPKAATEQLPWNDECTLSMRGVTISHKQGSGSEYEALQRIDASVSGCRRIGIVGSSGAGKSTLARMLAGFSSPSRGAIELNGVEIGSLNSDAWRENAVCIPQDPFIFHATLRENICFYCPDASDDQVESAVEAMRLDELVRELPQGLDTIIGQGERPISGGQAQRIALARAFIDKTRKIVVFDEPTAHLDIETELELKPEMLRLMEGRLVFFATHRLHWMQDMDEIWVLGDNTILERGTLAQLQASRGAYGALARNLRGGE